MYMLILHKRYVGERFLLAKEKKMTTAANMTSLVQSMNLQELEKLRALIVEKQNSRLKEIQELYGKMVTGIIGIETIDAIPQVKAQEVNLEDDRNYPDCAVRPSMLGNRSVVRGVMGSGRPFIALKIELLDCTTREQAGIVVELLMKRYALEGPDNYTMPTNTCDDQGEHFYCSFRTAGGLDEEQIGLVKKLLQGEEIQTRTPSYLMRLFKERVSA
jgi:hypothetical protein